jgi:hypothetical protein
VIPLMIAALGSLLAPYEWYLWREDRAHRTSAWDGLSGISRR